MAKKPPFFITGANAKVKVNGKTLALCTDFQYTIKVSHAAPKVLGMYESFTIEPLSFDVTGSFSVIRYTSGLKSFIEDSGLTAPDLVNNSGNGVGAMGPNNTLDKILGTIGVPFSAEGRADQSFNPARLFQAMMFDIEVSQASLGGELGIFARLRDCRLTGSDLKITKRGTTVQVFTFMACYPDEDSFNAAFSGVGQNLS